MRVNQMQMKKNDGELEAQAKRLRRQGNGIKVIARICGISESRVCEWTDDSYADYLIELNAKLHARAETSDQILIKLAQRHKLLDHEINNNTVNITVESLDALQSAISARYRTIDALVETRIADRSKKDQKLIEMKQKTDDDELMAWYDKQVD